MWAALILAVLSFFVSKKSGASDKKAMLAAAGVGAGTYYLATQTEWGQENLNWFEGESSGGSSSNTPVVSTSGTQVKNPDGSTLGTIVNGTTDVLKSWGGTGTAAVIGTTGLVASSSLQKYLPWVLGIGAILLLTK